MAIDSREKRQSVVAISFYPMGPSVTPNASKDQEWRQEAGYSYSGIAAGAPQEVFRRRVGMSISGMMRM